MDTTQNWLLEGLVDPNEPAFRFDFNNQNKTDRITNDLDIDEESQEIKKESTFRFNEEDIMFSQMHDIHNVKLGEKQFEEISRDSLAKIDFVCIFLF